MEISDDVFAAAESRVDRLAGGGRKAEGEEEEALSPRPPAPRRHDCSAARQPRAGDGEREEEASWRRGPQAGETGGPRLRLGGRPQTGPG